MCTAHTHTLHVLSSRVYYKTYDYATTLFLAIFNETYQDKAALEFPPETWCIFLDANDIYNSVAAHTEQRNDGDGLAMYWETISTT